MSKFSEEQIIRIVYDAMNCFNYEMEFDITPENTILEFFTPANGIAVYEELCDKHFPNWLKDNYKEDGYFESFIASVFVGEKYGILIRSDMDLSYEEWFRIFLHEISHMFCFVNEIEGGFFFDRYCDGPTGSDNGMINAGYAVWREAIADIMAHLVDPYSGRYNLNYVKNNVLELYNDICAIDGQSKKAMSLIIVYIMITDEVLRAKNWKSVCEKVKKVIGINDDTLFFLLELVYDNLHHGDYWTISTDFIFSLGDLYLMVLVNKKFRHNIFG